MGIYTEISSMIGSSSRMCADRSPKPAKPSAGPLKIEQPHADDALRPGTCLRCGCRTGTAHATPNDCIDALRAALADVWSGEVRRIGRPAHGGKIARGKGAGDVTE